MDFDDWMLTKDPKYHPTDDTVALRRLRECWTDAQKYAVLPAPTFQDSMTEMPGSLASALASIGIGAAKKCQHKNRECTYESDDGEFERWQCKDCGERWGVEIAQ